MLIRRNIVSSLVSVTSLLILRMQNQIPARDQNQQEEQDSHPYKKRLAESQGLLIRRNIVSSLVSVTSLLILRMQNQIPARDQNQQEEQDSHPYKKRLAESQGFEPWVGLHPQRFSRPPRMSRRMTGIQPLRHRVMQHGRTLRKYLTIYNISYLFVKQFFPFRSF